MNITLASENEYTIIFDQLESLISKENIDNLTKHYKVLINRSEKRKSVYMVTEEIFKQYQELFTTEESRKDLYWIGERIGFLMKEKLLIGIEGLSVLGELFTEKIILKEKNATKFLYGRDVIIQENTSKYTKETIKLIQDEKGRTLGLGKLVYNEKGEIFKVKNVVDLGKYLRGEKTLFGN